MISGCSKASRSLFLELAWNLRELGQLRRPVTQLNISRIVGKPSASLKCSSQIRTLLEQFDRGYHSTRDVCFDHTEDEMVARVQEAIRRCEAAGRIPSKRAIAKMVGVSLDEVLQFFPKVMLLLNQVAQKWLDSRRERVEREVKAIEHLEAQWNLSFNGSTWRSLLWLSRKQQTSFATIGLPWSRWTFREVFFLLL